MTQRSKTKTGNRKMGHPDEMFHVLFDEAPISLWHKNFSDVKQYIDQLKASGVDDLRAYFESQPEAVHECVRKTRVIGINKATLNLYRARSRKELLEGIDKTFTKESFEVFREELLALAEGKTFFSSEAVTKMLTGEFIDIIIQVVIVPGCEDTWEHVLVSIADITERKRVEEALVASEEKFRDLADKSLAGIYLVQNGLFKYVNPKLAEIFGYAEEELIDRLGPKQVVLDEDWPTVSENLRRRVEGKEKSIHYTFRGVTKDKKVIMAEVFGSATHYQGKPAVIGTMLDITERIRAEETLRNIRARYEEAQRIAHMGHWTLDLVSNELVWSAEVYRLFEVDPAKFGASYEAFLDTVHPDDRDFVNMAYISSVEGKKPYDIEHRLLFADGRVKWVNERCETCYDEDGKPLRSLGTVLDITERHEAQKKLRASLIGSIVAMSKAIGARDPYTAGHQQRVSELARSIAQEMGLDSERIDALRMGAAIHDIGKIYVPAEMLSKPTKLTAAEFEIIKSHCQVGYDILKDIPSHWPIADIAHQHHERLDGTGYPQGLKGDEICLEARIVAVADVLEAISSHRPYRPALGIDVALKEIETKRGTWYDADAVDICLRLFREKKFSFKN